VVASPLPYGCDDDCNSVRIQKPHLRYNKVFIAGPFNPFPNSSPHDRIGAIVGIEDEINRRPRNEF